MGDYVWRKAVEWLNRVPCGVHLGSNQCYVPFEVHYLIAPSVELSSPAGRNLTTAEHVSLVGAGAPGGRRQRDISLSTFSWRMDKTCWIDRLDIETVMGCGGQLHDRKYI